MTILGVSGGYAVLFADTLVWHLLHQGELLVLTVSAAALLLAFDCLARSRPDRVLVGTNWLCSLGRLSYEICLSHMFVVFALVALFRITGSNLRFGFLGSPVALARAWLLGSSIDRLLSTPSNRALRNKLI